MDTIHLYGDIGSSFWSEGISAKDVVLSLRELDQSSMKHYAHINSPGGLVDEGLAIMNILLAHKRQMKLINPDFQLETVVDGYCMSAATCPLMAGDIRTLALGGVVMIHNAWSYSSGDAAAMRKTADALDKLSENAANIYATLCTPADEKSAARDKAYFKKLMDEETYFVGDECLASGLITAMDQSHQAVLSTDFTPEKLKGHYVERMTSGRIKTTLNRPIDSKFLKEKEEAFKLLQMTAASLGIKF